MYCPHTLAPTYSHEGHPTVAVAPSHAPIHSYAAHLTVRIAIIYKCIYKSQWLKRTLPGLHSLIRDHGSAHHRFCCCPEGIWIQSSTWNCTAICTHAWSGLLCWGCEGLRLDVDGQGLHGMRFGGCMAYAVCSCHQSTANLTNCKPMIPIMITP